MVSRSDVQLNQNTVYSNLWEDNTKVAIKESDMIAFKLDFIFYHHTDPDDLRDVLDITLSHRSQYYDDRGFAHFEVKPLKFDS